MIRNVLMKQTRDSTVYYINVIQKPFRIELQELELRSDKYRNLFVGCKGNWKQVRQGPDALLKFSLGNKTKANYSQKVIRSKGR